MRRTARPIALAAALAASACATSGAQQPTTQAPPPSSPVATHHPYDKDTPVAIRIEAKPHR